MFFSCGTVNIKSDENSRQDKQIQVTLFFILICMPWPLTGAINYHAHERLPDKGCVTVQ